MPSRRAVLGWSGVLLATAIPLRALWAAGDSTQLNVRSYGATGNGKTTDTRAIQAAIDAAGHSGGAIYFPPGEYISGTPHLRRRERESHPEVADRGNRPLTRIYPSGGRVHRRLTAGKPRLAREPGGLTACPMPFGASRCA